MDAEISDVPQKRRINRLTVIAIALIVILLLVLLLNEVLSSAHFGVFSNIMPNL